MADYKFTVENWAFFYSPGPNRCTIFTDAPNSACFHQTSYREQDDHCMCPASIALKNSWIYYDIAEYGCFVGTRQAQECRIWMHRLGPGKHKNALTSYAFGILIWALTPYRRASE